MIHIASVDDANLVTQTAATLDHGQSEVAINDIALCEFEGFSMPRVAGCNIAYGCELYKIKEMGEVPQTLVFVEIKTLFLGDEVVSLDHKKRIKVDADKVNPLARLGGGEYSGITSAFGIERPE